MLACSRYDGQLLRSSASFNGSDKLLPPSDTSHVTPKRKHGSTVNGLRQAFKTALQNHDFFSANTITMEAVEHLFRSGREDARQIVWDTFFSRLAGKAIVQYQCYDFESVDYELYPVEGVSRFLRGPKPDLRGAAGKYVTFLGAAQFFGRHRRKALHTFVAETIGRPCVNLGIGGAGPEFFLSDNVLRIANAGAAVVLQIMSGRSVGCDEYPGGDVTFRKDTKKKVKRLVLLSEIWNDSRDEALRLVRKWQKNYVQEMLHLLADIYVPVVLVWLSSRAPDEWSVDKLREVDDAGQFPQLVDRAMLRELTSKSTELVSVTRDEGLPEELLSRFSGEKCPVFVRDGSLRWRNRYYPSAAAVEQAGIGIAAVLQALGSCW